jgi:hypothetical protein
VSERPEGSDSIEPEGLGGVPLRRSHWSVNTLTAILGGFAVAYLVFKLLGGIGPGGFLAIFKLLVAGVVWLIAGAVFLSRIEGEARSRESRRMARLVALGAFILVTLPMMIWS